MKLSRSKYNKPVKIKMAIQPVVAERLDHFCERFHCSFVEAAHIVLNENLKLWEEGVYLAQGDNRPQEKVGYSALPKTGPDGKRYLK